MKIIIAGATGYVGSKLYAELSKSCAVIGTNSSGGDGLVRLDFGAPGDFDYNLIEAGDMVIVTAAISAPDICASQFEFAYRVNVIGTSEFVDRALRRKARVLFFSSDTVYGGSEEAATETSPCRPVGEYGIMKRELELLFLDDPRFKAIRLSYIFSREDKFTRYLEGCADAGRTADIFHPFYRKVIYRGDVIAGVCALVSEWERFTFPIINFGGRELISRKEIAERLKAVALPTLRYSVSEPAPDFFRNRPRYINMSSDLLHTILGDATHTMNEAIAAEYGYGV